MPRRNLTQAISLTKLFDLYRGKCFYCGCNVHRTCYFNGFRKQCPSCATRDHELSLKCGGRNAVDNIVLSCFGCNQGKDNFLKSIRGVLQATGG